MGYQMKREDVFSFADSRNAETRQKGNELEFKYCPYCEGGAHHDKYTFSINLENGAFKCLRASCNQQGHFVELCRDFDFPLDFEVPRIYRKLPQKQLEAKPESIRYMESRGISEEITRKYQITTWEKNSKIIVFPFYDEDGTMVFAKYRNTVFKKGDSGSKEWAEHDTMPILFGMNHCKGFDRLIITEGQIDSLSVAEAGFDNAVSVPTGATGFTWLTHNWIWITKFKEVIVFGDCEHGKITLLDTLSARLPKEITVKAVRVKDYLGEKDANDILRKYGKKAIKACIDNAEIPNLDNVKELADVQSVDINRLDKIETGIDLLDRTIRGMAMGQLVILTGKRGDGKSTLMSQLVCAALEQKRNVFVYSGELADFHFKRWLDYQLAGSANIIEQNNKWGDKDYALSKDVIENINRWYRHRAFIYDNNFIADGSEMETLPQTIEKAILKYNVQFICIDNLMTAMERVTEQNNLYLAQSNFVGRLKAIAMKYSVVILLVAHPKKGTANEFQDDNELIAGSSDITNKADIILRYERVEGEEDSNGLIKVTKNRIMGILRTTKETAVRTWYSPMTKRIVDVRDKKEYMYSWFKQTDEYQRISRKEELPF